MFQLMNGWFSAVPYLLHACFDEKIDPQDTSKLLQAFPRNFTHENSSLCSKTRIWLICIENRGIKCLQIRLRLQEIEFARSKCSWRRALEPLSH